MSKEQTENKPVEEKLGGDTYAVLQSRLKQQGNELSKRLSQLNKDRKEVFGAIETKLITTERITTEHNCVPVDIVPLGDLFLFGYNVQFGLKSETNVSDVFSVYRFSEQGFKQEPMDVIKNESFEEDFKNIYKYYKHARFVKFATKQTVLYMVFQIGTGLQDIKVFKWLMREDGLEYQDSRSEHEYSYPSQHEFTWQRASRDMHRSGIHPHISIEDKVFVETIAGDLTIKVEDNTESGLGIYSEEVDHKDQKLDDADIYFAVIGNLILLKIKPYQEKKFRLFIFNIKLQQVKRVDAIEDACILLPQDQGLIFPNGYYLQNGDYKLFDHHLSGMTYERKIAAPNGEDYLFVFFNREEGEYLLLPYNIISQQIDPMLVCHGFSIFENGQMIYFKSDQEAKKHHVIQIWSTPFTGSDYQIKEHTDSFLYKLGNRDIVRAMSECHEINNLINKEDNYANLYLDIRKQSNDVLDSYYWIKNEETHSLHEPLKSIMDTANLAIAEFEKVTEIKKANRKQFADLQAKVKKEISTLNNEKPTDIQGYVQHLARIRELRGELTGVSELKYVDRDKVKELEAMLLEENDHLSEACVQFLLSDESMKPYDNKVDEIQLAIPDLKKAIDAEELGEEIQATSAELEMLIDIVSNLKIEDATKTTEIIDHISGLFTRFNQINAALKKKKKELQSKEGIAEFGAQIKLVEQGMINYLDVSDSPEKCDEYQSKLLIQLEELEGKFADFDEFLEKIQQKREDIYNSFENKRLYLVEQKNKKAERLVSTAGRILKNIENRIKRMSSEKEINGYFASDILVEKIRNSINDLSAMGETVKSDDIQSRLKSTREEAIRQLHDKQELYAEGENKIKFGSHVFNVNTQELQPTLVYRDESLYFHLTGTGFYEKLRDPEMLELKKYWERDFPSESDEVYRAEYLAYSFLKSLGKADRQSFMAATKKEKEADVATFMSERIEEGYIKGIHDHDAALIASEVVRIEEQIGLLRYDVDARACAQIFWKSYIPEPEQQSFVNQINGAGILANIFPGAQEFRELKSSLQKRMHEFLEETQLFDPAVTYEAALYLFDELVTDEFFIIHGKSAELHHAFLEKLKGQNVYEKFNTTIRTMGSLVTDAIHQIRNWLHAFIEHEKWEGYEKYVNEAAAILFCDNFHDHKVFQASQDMEIKDMRGDHKRILKSIYYLNYRDFNDRLEKFDKEEKPAFLRYKSKKAEAVKYFESDLRLNEFKPTVLSSFVRNQLIDKVYLPLIGNNLAKQIGSAGAAKRTDLMGMLLLISPPGYGKTTLMEYIAARLGLTFVKVNGPSLGHHVVSLDPDSAGNAAAAEELEKLNLSFEMGDNVMIYLDDIQHCNPEFLQKFISLCDAQRKIDGVYKGRAKTYDFKGKKVCVVMAGNPYTESGEKFQIPDMLANRADIYNLGDIIGDSEGVFKLSYIENALTSNSTVASIAGKSRKDMQRFISAAEKNQDSVSDLEGNYAASEIANALDVLRKMYSVRDVLLTVNMEYIRSASQSDEFRTEPPFKLQGSYRDMNKLAEKILPVQTKEEVDELIMDHYDSESQTLTSGAESNLLKLKELLGIMTDTEKQRWEDIKATYVKNNKFKQMGMDDQMGKLVVLLDDISTGLNGIETALHGRENGKVKTGSTQPEELIRILDKLTEQQKNLRDELIAAEAEQRTKWLREKKELLRDIHQLSHQATLVRPDEEEVEQAKENEETEKLRKQLDVQLKDMEFIRDEEQAYVTYRFIFKNKTKKEISDFRGTVYFHNEDGEEIYFLNLNYQEGLGPGGSVSWLAHTFYNEFFEQDAALKNTPFENISIKWVPEEVGFS